MDTILLWAVTCILVTALLVVVLVILDNIKRYERP